MNILKFSSVFIRLAAFIPMIIETDFRFKKMYNLLNALKKKSNVRGEKK